jgi:hypothetical protein
VAKVLGALLLAFSSAALAQVELLYVGAADCGFCRRWEAQYLERGQPKARLDWAAVRFTPVDIGSFRAAFDANSAPAHLRPGLAKALAASGRTTLRGTPWFALFVDGEVRAHGFGLNAFESRIQPAMRALLREKT